MEQCQKTAHPDPRGSQCPRKAGRGESGESRRQRKEPGLWLGTSRLSRGFPGDCCRSHSQAGVGTKLAVPKPIPRRSTMEQNSRD